MYRIIEVVRQADLASLLQDIHLWLDQNGCTSDSLTTEKETLSITAVQIGFDCRELAEAFTQAFQGRALVPAVISEANDPTAHSEAGRSTKYSFSPSGTPKACQAEGDMGLREYAWSDFAHC